MSTITIDDTDGSTSTRAVGGPTASAFTRWPLFGLAAGAFGFVSTMLSPQSTDDVYDRGVEAVYADMGSRTTVWLGASLGFAAVVCLAIFTVGLVRHLQAKGSSGAVVDFIRLGLTAAIGSLTIGYGFKAMHAGGMPDGIDESFYTTTDSTVVRLIADQVQWLAWVGVVLAIGAVAVLSLRDKALPRWFGGLSALMAAAVAAATIGAALPYSAGVVAPVWLVIATVPFLRSQRRS